MINFQYDRRKFLKTSLLAGLGLGVSGRLDNLYAQTGARQTRVGIIGLDTSHSVAFTKALNSPGANSLFAEFRVVAAYPGGSRDIESSIGRVKGFTEDVKKLGVEIVDSIGRLLEMTDVVLLETNDGRLHYEQVIQVFRAGKKVFIDKPVAASLADAIAIFDAAKKYNVPVFSSSSLRYIPNAQVIAKGELIGKVTGADTYSPATLEKTHPDLFWYGVHGVEILFTVMGTGCKTVSRIATEDTDIATGVWEDSRVGSFRGIRSGKKGYGGTVFGEKGIAVLDPYTGYDLLLEQIINFFKTGIAPVKPEETLEIFAFMEAAEESKRLGGKPVFIKDVLDKAGTGSRNNIR